MTRLNENSALTGPTEFSDNKNSTYQIAQTQNNHHQNRHQINQHQNRHQRKINTIQRKCVIKTGRMTR